MSRYLIIIEDLDGLVCVATGVTRNEVEVHDAIELPIDSALKKYSKNNSWPLFGFG